MPINHDMMHSQTNSLFEKAGDVLDGVVKLKERIAELEHDRDWWKSEAQRQETLATQNWDYHKRMEKEWLRCNNAYIRSMWLARAERAVAEQTIDEWSRYREKHPSGSWRVDPFEYWVRAWINVEKLCRKKAEEYK